MSTENFLWVLLSLVLLCVFCWGIYDPSLRPAMMDIAKFALGGILTAVSTVVLAKK